MPLPKLDLLGELYSILGKPKPGGTPAAAPPPVPAAAAGPAPLAGVSGDAIRDDDEAALAAERQACREALAEVRAELALSRAREAELVQQRGAGVAVQLGGGHVHGVGGENEAVRPPGAAEAPPEEVQEGPPARIRRVLGGQGVRDGFLQRLDPCRERFGVVWIGCADGGVDPEAHLDPADNRLQSVLEQLCASPPGHRQDGVAA
jgi:hypothetical protein